MYSHTDPRQDILNHPGWFLGDSLKYHRLVDGHQQGQKIVASLAGLTSPEDAREWLGKKIFIAVADLPPLAEGEFYWTQLEGLQAVDAAGTSLGVVDHLFETGANDVLVIKRGDDELLVPCVPAVVRKVDLENGLIVLDWDGDAW